VCRVGLKCKGWNTTIRNRNQPRLVGYDSAFKYGQHYRGLFVGLANIFRPDNLIFPRLPREAGR
jgi:hypothetical protein